MKDLWKLTSKDFIPLYGINRYHDRVSEYHEDSKEYKKASRREIALLFYNTITITAIGATASGLTGKAVGGEVGKIIALTGCLGTGSVVGSCYLKTISK